MSNFTRFQERNRARKVAQDKMNSNFILKGYPSVKIEGAEETMFASVVNKQEKDYAYIITPSEKQLKVGSVWKAKSLNFMITEEIVFMKDVNFRKYHALLCNVEVDGQWGYFKGPEKSFLDISLEKEVVWESPQKPVLVLASNALNFRDKIVITNRAWLVQEYDAISTPGLVYYSLKPTTIKKETIEKNQGKDVYVEKYEPENFDFIEEPIQTKNINNEAIISHNVPITIMTQDGYFKFNNNNIQIQKRTSTMIVFTMPFGVDNVEIEYIEKGEKVKQTYRAV